MTNVPFVGRMVNYFLFNGDDIVYLPGDHLISVNQSLTDQVEDTVLPSRVVEYFINNAKYLWVMDFCICRESDNCQDYPKDLGCLFLGAAVLKINPKIGRLVSKSDALNHVLRCREAGLVHMVGRNKLDSVWLSATPSENLLTICNCCPCCLWKIIPHTHLSPSTA
jgi:hypothetical protein